jgi:hypothetical protein
MTTVSEIFMRDANGVPITWAGLIAKKTIAYTGAASAGAIGATTLFTVTGNVLARVIGVCSEDLAGASAIIEVGVAGNTGGLIAQTTATDIDNGEAWVDATPGLQEQLSATPRIIAAGADIIETIATANITDGTITYYCLWTPLDVGASVVPA